MSIPEHRVLIVFFSRDGLSERIAIDLHARVPSDIVKLSETFDRSGAMNYFTSFRESYFGTDNSAYLVKDAIPNPAPYAAVVFIGPVWWWGLNGPLKNACKLIAETIQPAQHVFLALSFAGKSRPGDKGSFDEFKAIFTGKAVVHDNYFGAQEQFYAEGKCKERFDAFVAEIQGVSAPAEGAVEAPAEDAPKEKDAAAQATDETPKEDANEPSNE